MKHKAFICHSNQDDIFAKRIVSTLEENQIFCWIAPRNIPAGAVWSDAIMEALESCTIMVMLFSSHSNKSRQVLTEIETAKERGIPIIPIIIEDVQLSRSLKYFIRSYQWIKAYGKNTELAFEKLIDSVKKNLLEVQHQNTKDLKVKSQNSQNKEEYRDLFDAFWEDKSISNKERTFLKKIQARLELTNQEVAEIEEEFIKESEIENQNNKTIEITDSTKSAQKPKPSFVQELTKICQRYEENKNFYTSYFIPDSLLDSFQTSLMISNADNIIALIDNSTFSSKKEGVIISEKGLYWHSKAKTPYYLSWPSFKNASILSVDKISLSIGGRILNTKTSRFDKTILLELLNRIKALLEK